MRRQAILSMPLSFAIVLVAAFAFSGAFRDAGGRDANAARHLLGPNRAETGPLLAENPGEAARSTVEIVAPSTDPEAKSSAIVSPAPVEIGAEVARVEGGRPGVDPPSVILPTADAHPRPPANDWRPRPAGSPSRFP